MRPPRGRDAGYSLRHAERRAQRAAPTTFRPGASARTGASGHHGPRGGSSGTFPPVEGSRRRPRSRPTLSLVAAVALAPAVAGCGSGPRQDANEASGTFSVEVVRASFPAHQHIAQQTELNIAVRNADNRTIPDIAVTIGSPEHAAGVSDTAAAAFGQASEQSGLASSSRPIWILDPNPSTASGAPGNFDPSAENTGPVNGQTANTNTWALGPLEPGRTRTFTWRVTAVRPGSHTISYTIAAGLNGKARAAFSGGRAPTGRLTVSISDRPAAGRLGPTGNVVTR